MQQEKRHSGVGGWAWWPRAGWGAWLGGSKPKSRTRARRLEVQVRRVNRAGVQVGRKSMGRWVPALIHGCIVEGTQKSSELMRAQDIA